MMMTTEMNFQQMQWWHGITAASSSSTSSELTPECLLFGFPLTNLLHIAILCTFLFMLRFLSSEIFLSTVTSKSEPLNFFIFFHSADTFNCTAFPFFPLCASVQALISFWNSFNLALFAIFKNTTTRANLNTQKLLVESSFDCKHKHSLCALQCHNHFLETSMPSFEITLTLRIGSIIRDSSKAEVKEIFRS